MNFSTHVEMYDYVTAIKYTGTTMVIGNRRKDKFSFIGGNQFGRTVLVGPSIRKEFFSIDGFPVGLVLSYQSGRIAIEDVGVRQIELVGLLSYWIVFVQENL